MAVRQKSSYDAAKDMLNVMRSMKNNARGNKFLKEDTEGGKPIAITNDPKFGQNVLQNQINAFRESVFLGARFGDEDAENPENNPLIYYPNSKNLVFSGTIPTLSNLKFQFSLNDANAAPYIFVDGLYLTQENIGILTKLFGYYRNWRDEFLNASDMLNSLSNTEEV